MKVLCKKCGYELYEKVSLDNGHIAYSPDSKARLESESKGDKKCWFCMCPKCGTRNEIPFHVPEEQLRNLLAKNPKS